MEKHKAATRPQLREDLLYMQQGAPSSAQQPAPEDEVLSQTVAPAVAPRLAESSADLCHVVLKVNGEEVGSHEYGEEKMHAAIGALQLVLRGRDRRAERYARKAKATLEAWQQTMPLLRGA